MSYGVELGIGSHIWGVALEYRSEGSKSVEQFVIYRGFRHVKGVVPDRDSVGNDSAAGATVKDCVAMVMVKCRAHIISILAAVIP